MPKTLSWLKDPTIRFIALAVGFSLLVGGGYFYVQQGEISKLRVEIQKVKDPKDKATLEKEQIALTNQIVGTIAQSFGGLLLFMTAYVSWQNLQETRRNVTVAEEKQVTERFTQAINQLGSEKLEVRLGGIYALERIAKDSEKDHWTIIEVLSSFIKEQSSLRTSAEPKPNRRSLIESLLAKDQGNDGKENVPKIGTDIQAALTVIGRRDPKKDPVAHQVDLGGANLSGANLIEANLNGANLCGANLSGANLIKADLCRAKLIEANLIKADLCRAKLIEANLNGADFSEAYLIKANFSSSHLRGAKLIEAHLSEADLSEAYLNLANLSGAYLGEADLSGAYLIKANFSGSNLSGANLKNAKEVTKQQLSSAVLCKTTLPDGTICNRDCK